jgi:hypothetical protein
MKVFVLDNHDSRCVMEGALIDVLQSIRYELENMEPGDDFTIECKEMTEEEVEALPDM